MIRRGAGSGTRIQAPRSRARSGRVWAARRPPASPGPASRGGTSQGPGAARKERSPVLRTACVTFLVLALVGIVGCPTVGKPKPGKSASTLPGKATPKARYEVEVLEEGSGPSPKEGQTVVIHYTGTLLDGTKFDSSYDRDKPFEFVVGKGTVIQGWENAITDMKVGGKYKLTVPPEMGYGKKEEGEIPPNSVLVFEMELLKIKAKPRKRA
ncbi:MAG: FKBP-type peptidyl-prolyl cis-trans isomerase [Candidatus Riflebacteria bacterium]|nr:FKBP-type peptidyl-prolyl cis-trans isomerase [Candidatus Riflebacteria bacterium]